MIYTVIGTQNTGKTTLINAFLEATPDFTTTELDYRKLIRAFELKINRNGNAPSQKLIFNSLLSQLIDTFIQTKLDNSSKNTIFDRSIIDAYVYTLWLYENIYKNSDAHHDEFVKVLSYMKECTLQNVNMYDKIFYIPLEQCTDVKIVADNFRDTDTHYRTQVDELFKYVLFDELYMFSDKITFVFGTTKERLEMLK